MKLNYKRTILVGFAFFLICAFWQAYDATIPVILTNKFGMSQTWSGVIMALDTVLAVFMLPIFGALSDKCGIFGIGGTLRNIGSIGIIAHRLQTDVFHISLPSGCILHAVPLPELLTIRIEVMPIV